jgi:hypothetical protein
MATWRVCAVLVWKIGFVNREKNDPSLSLFEAESQLWREPDVTNVLGSSSRR